MCCAVIARSGIDWCMRCEARTVHAQGQFTYRWLIWAPEQTYTQYSIIREYTVMEEASWEFADSNKKARLLRLSLDGAACDCIQMQLAWDSHGMLLKAKYKWYIDWIKPANLYTRITIKMTHDHIKSTPIFSELPTTSSAKKGHALVAANVEV